MRIRTGYIICLLLLLTNPEYGLSRSYNSADTVFTLEEGYNERFELMTDRTIYAVGERIYFKAFNISHRLIKSACWSKVIYVQLFHQDGRSVANGKFRLSCTGSNGYIDIPENILTGNYYLAAQTKWMRNFSELNYGFQALKIINPYSGQLDVLQQTDRLQTIMETSREAHSVSGNSVLLSTDKRSYESGEKVTCSIQIPNLSNSETVWLAAVAGRPGAIDTLASAMIMPVTTERDRNYDVRFLPEIMGLSLSGKIRIKESLKSAENARVELSILGKQPRLLVSFTNKDGVFYFDLDSITGAHEFFLAARHEQYPDLEFEIDKDFVDIPSAIGNKSFTLSPSEKRLAKEIMINMQAERIYKLSSAAADSEQDPYPGRSAFYDIPIEPLLIETYIELPNLKEVFIELIPEITPKLRRKVPYLYFSGNQVTSRLIGNYEPLILIDQLPVYDLEKVLSLVPKRIQSIEVINEIYALGNTQYGGVINIKSKNGDLAGIDLPDNSLFFQFSGFLPQSNKRESLDRTEDPDIPDFRNCLMWEPDIRMQNGQSRILEFNTSDRSGRYIILIRGFSDSGTLYQGTTYFEVK